MMDLGQADAIEVGLGSRMSATSRSGTEEHAERAPTEATQTPDVGPGTETASAVAAGAQAGRVSRRRGSEGVQRGDGCIVDPLPAPVRASSYSARTSIMPGANTTQLTHTHTHRELYC